MTDRTFTVPTGATHQFQVTLPVLRRVGAWIDDLPPEHELDARIELADRADATERLAHAASSTTRPTEGDDQRDYDAYQCEQWLARILELELTDVVITIDCDAGHGRRDVVRGGRRVRLDEPYRVAHGLDEGCWRRLAFLVRTLTGHCGPDGSPLAPNVHLMIFCGVNPDFIAAAAASAIDACRYAAPIASVMLDCEGWWRGNRRYHRPPEMRQLAADAVRACFVDGWPGARPPEGVGVTGVASAPSPELLELLDYGVPQIYGSRANLGDTFRTARTKHRFYYRKWHDAFSASRPADARRVIVGHTANGKFVDAARMRMLVRAALEIGGSGSPPLTYPDTLFYWSTKHLRGERGNEVRRIAHLARNGGVHSWDVGGPRPHADAP